MIRCCHCYRWFHEDCVADIFNAATDNAWWICSCCRQLAATVATLATTLQSVCTKLAALEAQNSALKASVATLQSSNDTLSAQVQSLSSLPHAAPCPHQHQSTGQDVPSLLLGDSTIRDVVATDPQLVVRSRSGGKTGDILGILKGIEPGQYADIAIHVGTNDCATRFPEDKIIQNYTQIISRAKALSSSGHVTISSIFQESIRRSRAQRVRA